MKGTTTVVSPGAERPPIDPWLPGERVGDHIVRALIGRGGMSSVWDAWDVELQRAVALKAVDDEDGGRTMLVHEARALAAVRHPGLPAVYGLGTSRGRRYLVLERLYGDTLERVMQQQVGGLELQEAFRILIDLAGVLHAVHQAGMVHHDVKPANIMLCREQRTVLLDFGIMLPAVRAATAERMGTPGYVAPEVVLDSVKPEDARLIDVYGFGVIAYEILSGRTLFRGVHVGAMLRSAATRQPEPLGALRRDIPPPLESLVHACLAKEPADRPKDMELVRAELCQIQRRRLRLRA